VPTILSSLIPTLIPTQVDTLLDGTSTPSVRPTTPRPSAASLSMTTMPTQSGTDKVPPAPNITLDVSMALPNTSSPSLSSIPTSSPLNETTTTTEATFSTTEVDKEEDDDDESEESTSTTATTSSSNNDDLWSSFNETASVVIDLGGSTSEGLNDTNSSVNNMNDTESTDDEGSTSTEQNIPTLAPQSSSISANKELDQTNNVDKSKQEKEGLSSGAKAGIVIVVLLVIGLGAAYLIHRRKEQEDQASSDSFDDEEAGLDLAEDDIDSATREASNREGFGGMNDDYIGVIVDE